MKKLALLFLMLLVSPAGAQQPSPSEFALQINTAIAQMAQRAELAERRVAQLGAHVIDLQKQLAEARKEEQPQPAEEPKN